MAYTPLTPLPPSSDDESPGERAAEEGGREGGGDEGGAGEGDGGGGRGEEKAGDVDTNSPGEDSSSSTSFTSSASAAASSVASFLTKAGAVTHDALPAASSVASTGFTVATKATSFGFDIAQGALTLSSAACVVGGAALTSLGLVTAGPALAAGGGAIYLANKGVGAAREITVVSQAVAKAATMAGLDAAALTTDAAGFVDGDGVKLFVSEDDIAAARFVQDLVKSFLEEIPEGVTLKDMTVALNALAVIHSRAQAGLPRPLNLPTASVSPSLVKFVRPSVAIYGRNPAAFLNIKELPGSSRSPATPCADLEAFCRIADVDPSKVLASDLKGATYLPGYIVHLDDAAQAVVVTVRGSINFPADILTDLVCELAQYSPPHDEASPPGSGAHRGMLEAATRLFPEISSPVASALLENPGHRLVLTGHSLGAGVATLLATMFGPTHLGHPVEAYAYAPPCTLTLEAALSCSHYVTSVVVGADVVPRFGLATSVDVREALLAVHAGGWRGELEDLRANVMTEGPKLFPGGRVVWIAPEEKRRGGGRLKQEAFEASNGVFDYMALQKGMLLSHMPQVYLREVEMLEVEGGE